MVTAERVLSFARGEIGYKEFPRNSNRTKYGRWFRLDGQPWCMMFVQWCFAQAGALDLLPKKTASCGDLMRAAQAAGRWISSGFQPGDVLIYDFPSTGAVTDHTGICESVQGDTVTAIEGNTSNGNDSNGGEVMRRTRKQAVVLSAVRPVWPNPPAIRVGDTVPFIGARQYLSSYPGAAEYPASPCEVTVTIVQEDRAHPYHVIGSGVHGWVNDADVLGVPYYRVRVRVESRLNIRSGPGAEHEITGGFENGQIVSIYDERDGWGRTADGGWIALKHTERA